MCPLCTGRVACRWPGPTTRCHRCDRLHTTQNRGKVLNCFICKRATAEVSGRSTLAGCKCHKQAQQTSGHNSGTHLRQQPLHRGSRQLLAPSLCGPCTCTVVSACVNHEKAWPVVLMLLQMPLRSMNPCPSILRVHKALAAKGAGKHDMQNTKHIAITCSAPAKQLRPGTCVLRSQKRTVVSPLPLASRRPSGLKLTDSTASTPQHSSSDSGPVKTRALQRKDFFECQRRGTMQRSLLMSK